MTKRMLIDASNAEETRVVVLDGNRLEDFDVETSTKKQLKGNIYLAKVVRVEPSLQAAFVEYGGGRHGFLAFGEIHPDYYQIPIADRQRLLAMQEEEARAEEAEDDEVDARPASPHASRAEEVPDEPAAAEIDEAVDGSGDGAGDGAGPAPVASVDEQVSPEMSTEPAFEPLDEIQVHEPSIDQHPADTAHIESALHEPASPEPSGDRHTEADAATLSDIAPANAPDLEEPPAAQALAVTSEFVHGEEIVQTLAIEEGLETSSETLVGDRVESVEETGPPPETVGGDSENGEAEEARERRAPPRFSRHYKIQEVIRRRQILLVQVVKEERGSKGAALTTFISLAGRFSVLMPNSPRGGGVSRKITSVADRRRLREIMTELDLPRGMGIIVRTAGANRPKPEIRRDCEYLLRLWDDIRDLTMKSVAPALIYEEASLIKRAIRDVYSRDVEEVVVDGEAGWKAARDFMRMLMPSHVKKVILWQDGQPLFAKSMVEAQLDAMMQPTVQLRSGGYLVINQTEALVAIDVNSGRSTRERGIEETALRTNMEAADEVARQLRLRDLAGLIVIDFIDMEARKHNAMVERRLKDALKVDRARIQVGAISHFGLMEMSRQRLRPSLTETSFVACSHCGGTGHLRSTESASLHVLRAIEEEGAKRRTAEIVVHVASVIALYILNHKRARLGEIEARYGMHVAFDSDDSLLPPQIRIDRVRAADPSELPAPISPTAMPSRAPVLVETTAEPFDDEAEDIETDDDIVDAAAPDGVRTEGGVAETEGERRNRRRRRRRRGRREDGAPGQAGAPRLDEAPGLGGTVVPLDAEQPDIGLGEGADHVAARGMADDHDDGADAAGVEEHAGDVMTDEAAAGEAGKGRRRGRRGGRRRRKDGTAETAGADAAEDIVADVEVDAAAEPVVDADGPAPARRGVRSVPIYAGPTPADPFAGAGFDIFDVIEQQEQAAEAAARGPQPQSRPQPPTPAPAPMAVSDPVTVSEASDGVVIQMTSVSRPEPATPEPRFAEPVQDHSVQARSGDAQPVEAQSGAHGSAHDASPAEPVAADPAPVEEPAPAEPAIRPLVIGRDEIAVEKKRGWWRR